MALSKLTACICAYKHENIFKNLTDKIFNYFRLEKEIKKKVKLSRLYTVTLSLIGMLLKHHVFPFPVFAATLF